MRLKYKRLASQRQEYDFEKVSSDHVQERIPLKGVCSLNPKP